MANSSRKDREAIDRFMEQYTSSFVDRDLNRFVEFHDDNVVCLPPGQPPIIGKSAWREWLSGWWDSMNLLETNETRQIDLIEGNLAVEWHTERMLASFGEGNPSESLDKGILVLRRQADKTWKIAYYCWNDLPQPA